MWWIVYTCVCAALVYYLYYILVSIFSHCLEYIVAVSEVVAVVNHTNLVGEVYRINVITSESIISISSYSIIIVITLALNVLSG